MSTNEPKGKKGKKATPAFSRKVVFYDAQLNSVEDKVEGIAPSATDLQGAIALFGGVEADVVAALNAIAKAKAIVAALKAKRESVGGVSERAILSAMKPFAYKYKDVKKREDRIEAFLAEAKSEGAYGDALRGAIANAQSEIDAAGDDDSDDEDSE